MHSLNDILKEFSYLNSTKASSFEEVFVYGISSPEYPKNNTFVLIKDLKFLNQFTSTNFSDSSISLIPIVSSDIRDCSELKDIDHLICEINFDQAIVDLSKYFHRHFERQTQCLLDGRQVGNTKIDPSVEIAQNVFIGESVEISEGCMIMPGCVIMPNVKIDSNVKIYPNVTIYPTTEIGKGVIIHSGSVIGSDGFGYNQINGEHQKVYHLGNVVIQNDVEIGANCTIDRGTFGPTIIGKGSKLDNLVHIAHNCILGDKVIVCGQSGLAGSVRVGEFSMLSGHVGVAPGVEIGEKTQVGGHSAVTGNLESGQIYSGYPARPLREWLRAQATLRKLVKK